MNITKKDATFKIVFYFFLNKKNKKNTVENKKNYIKMTSKTYIKF